jgi:alpha-tubulin suppressor-like RCC1 family protein
MMLITKKGELSGSGSNDYGQIGIHDKTKLFKSICCAYGYTIGITHDHKLYKWGINDDEQSDYSTGVPIQIQVPGIPNNSFKFVSCGNNHSIAITLNGQLYGWGSNASNQLGLEEDKIFGVLTKINVPSTDKSSNLSFKSVACGIYHSMVLSSTNELYVSGSNRCGQLGLGKDISDKKIFTKIPNLSFKFIAAKYYQSTAITTNGELYYWGWNSFCENGERVFDLVYEPIKISNLLFKMVKCGHLHMMALTTDGKLYVQGGNFSGQLGIPNTSYELELTEMKELPNTTFKYITCGHFSSAAVTSENKLYVWGANDYRHLGLNDDVKRDKPTILTFSDPNNDLKNYGDFSWSKKRLLWLAKLKNQGLIAKLPNDIIKVIIKTINYEE